MKKLGLSLVGLFVIGLVAQTASARLPYRKEAEGKWGESKIAVILKEEKCFFCHVKDQGKEMRNDLGLALMKSGLSEEKYNELKSDKEKLSVYVKAALTKVLEEKSSKGPKFGELIEKGEDPSTDPEIEE